MKRTLPERAPAESSPVLKKMATRYSVDIVGAVQYYDNLAVRLRLVI